MCGWGARGGCLDVTLTPAERSLSLGKQRQRHRANKGGAGGKIEFSAAERASERPVLIERGWQLCGGREGAGGGGDGTEGFSLARRMTAAW